MKRKVISMLMVLVLVFCSSAAAFADSSTGVTPRYAATQSIAVTFSIKSGVATTGVTVVPISSSGMDKVSATVKLINASTGKTVKTWTQTLTYDSDFEDFYGEKSVSLSSKGSYYVTVSAKCYDGSSLLETLSITSKTQTY